MQGLVASRKCGLQFLVLETEAQQPVICHHPTEEQQQDSGESWRVFRSGARRSPEPVSDKRETEERDRAGKDVMRDPQ